MTELPIAVPGDAPVTSRAAGALRWTRRRGQLQLWLPGAVLVILVLSCFLGPVVVDLPGPSDGVLSDARLPMFSPGHFLGTDSIGNDLLSGSLHGGRISFIVGISSVAIGLFIGATIGVVSAFSRRSVETGLLWLIDVLIAFPSLVLALALAAYLGPGILNIIFAVAVFNIPANARLSRAATRRVLAQDFIVGTRLLGARPAYIVTRHVVPNIMGELVTFNVIRVGQAMVIEASLSFLGLGIPPPAASLGSMISTGAQDLRLDPTIMLVPAAFLFVTVLSVNLTGDALRARWEAR